MYQSIISNRCNHTSVQLSRRVTNDAYSSCGVITLVAIDNRSDNQGTSIVCGAYIVCRNSASDNHGTHSTRHDSNGDVDKHTVQVKLQFYTVVPLNSYDLSPPSVHFPDFLPSPRSPVSLPLPLKQLARITSWLATTA